MACYNQVFACVDSDPAFTFEITLTFLAFVRSQRDAERGKAFICLILV